MSLDSLIPFPGCTLGGDEVRDTNQEGLTHQYEIATTGQRSASRRITLKTKLLLAAGIILSMSAFAQTNSQTTVAIEPMAQTPTFRVVVTSRTTPAVNYKHRSGSTKVDFAGTDLMPSAAGVAEVNSKRGAIEIEAEFGSLQNPTTFGN